MPFLSLIAPPIALLVSHATGVPLLLPFLATLFFYPLFYKTLKDQQWGYAYGHAFLWALSSTVTVLWYLQTYPQGISLIIFGKPYQESMRQWVESGMGKESTPSQFLPEHAWHLLLFCVLCYLTIGFLGLVMGAILLNYMNAYVAWVVTHGGWEGFILGWHPWAVIRVLAYLALGVFLASRRMGKRPPPFLLWVGLGGVLMDALIKALLAPSYGRLLKALLFSG